MLYSTTAILLIAGSTNGYVHTGRLVPGRQRQTAASFSHRKAVVPEHAFQMSALVEDAKAVWLAKLDDVGQWGPKGVVTSTGGAASAPTHLNEDAAKAAWLARLDAPTWGSKPAEAPSTAVAPAVSTTVELMSKAEEAAKQAWLARLDAPTWGKAAAAIATVATDDEEAKRAWIARLDTPTWGALAATVSEVASVAAEMSEKQPSVSPTPEEEAKKAWLSKLDAPTWKKAADALVQAAGASSAAEEMAKQAFLAKIDAIYQSGPRALPSSAARVPAVPVPTSEVSEMAASDEAAAKAAWLAKLEKVKELGAATLFGSSMSVIGQQLAAECDAGDDVACEVLDDVHSAEEAAKRAWLASLDAPTWGAVSAAVSTVSAEVASQPAMSAEEIAKRAWLAKLDQ